MQSLRSPPLIPHRVPSHRGAEAAATHGAPELPKGLPGDAGGVEALSQKHDAVEEEKRGQAIDDVLEILNAKKEGSKSVKMCEPPDQSGGCSGHSHVGEGDVVLEVTGKICLDEPLCLSEGLVPTPAEEGNAGETQQRGHQGAVRHPSQTAHTAVIATCNTTAISHI